MKKFSIASAAALLVLTSSFAMADNDAPAAAQVCTGTADLTALDVGCDGEATRTISLAACDFRAGKVPNVVITSVIDGRASSIASVTVQSTDTSNFTVLITPLPRHDNNNVCKVQTVDWSAQ